MVSGSVIYTKLGIVLGNARSGIAALPNIMAVVYHGLRGQGIRNMAYAWWNSRNELALTSFKKTSDSLSKQGYSMEEYDGEIWVRYPCSMNR
jgi:hypothetical protein